MTERKQLTSGRARRAIKIGGLASQVGSSYLWTTLRKQFLSADAGRRELLDVHIRNARRIVESSKELRGAFMKLIQMLSMRHDILPDAKETLDLVHSGYVHGEFGYLELLTSQRTYFRVNLAYLESLGKLWISSVRIEGLLLSGGLESPER